METRVTAEIHDGPFQAQRDARGELGELAQRTPEEIRAEEQAAIDSAQGGHGAICRCRRSPRCMPLEAHTVGGRRRRAGAHDRQRGAHPRQRVPARAGDLDAAQHDVDGLLTPLTRTALAQWDAGLARLLTGVPRRARRGPAVDRRSALGRRGHDRRDRRLRRWATRLGHRPSTTGRSASSATASATLLLTISSDVNAVIAAAQARHRPRARRHQRAVRPNGGRVPRIRGPRARALCGNARRPVDPGSTTRKPALFATSPRAPSPRSTRPTRTVQEARGGGRAHRPRGRRHRGVHRRPRAGDHQRPAAAGRHPAGRVLVAHRADRAGDQRHRRRPRELHQQPRRRREDRVLSSSSTTSALHLHRRVLELALLGSPDPHPDAHQLRPDVARHVCAAAHGDHVAQHPRDPRAAHRARGRGAARDRVADHLRADQPGAPGPRRHDQGAAARQRTSWG